MKRPQPNLEDRMRRKLIGNMASVRKLMRLWGTETIDGVEVLHYRRFYYPQYLRPDNYEKLTKYLGAYDDLEEYSPEGIESAWFFLNKNKGPKPETPSYAEEVKKFISKNLNVMWWNILDGDFPSGLTLTATIAIESDSTLAEKNTGKATVQSITAAASTKQALIDAVRDNYNDLWLTSRITQRGIGVITKGTVTNPDTLVVTPDTDDLTHQDPWMSTATRYALRSQGIPCTIKKVSKGLTVNQEFDPRKKSTALLVTIEMPYIEFTEASPMVVAIASDLGAADFAPTRIPWNSKYGKTTATPNSYITKNKIKGMDNSDLASNPNYVSRPYTLWENAVEISNSSYNNLWYKGRLRADALRNPRAFGHTFESLASYVPQLVDTGYEEEDNDGSFFQKLVAIVIFIVIVVFTGPFGAGTTFSWGALAAAVTTAALVLSLATLAFGAMGQTEWASAFASVNRAIEPLTLLASIYLLFVGSAQQSLRDRIQKEGLAKVAKDLATDFVKDLVDNLIQGAADAFSGKLTKLSLEFASKLIDLVSMMEKNKLEAINDKNKDLAAEYEKLKEEIAGESDILQGFMHIYPKPATADWSMYASLFDMPYERGGGTMSLGNIQRTTKQALRKTDYSDPAFETILVF